MDLLKRLQTPDPDGLVRAARHADQHVTFGAESRDPFDVTFEDVAGVGGLQTPAAV